MHGKHIEGLAHFLAQMLKFHQPGSVLFGGDDDFRSVQGCETAVDGSLILGAVRVVVGKGHGRYLHSIGLQVEHHLLGRGDTGEQQHLVAANVVEPECLIAEELVQPAIVQGGEEELLIGIEIHGLGEHTELHGSEVLRTLGHNNHVGTALAGEGLAQPACWQQLVVDDETVIVDKQNIDAGLYIAVLKGVIEQNDVDILRLGILGQPPDTLTAVAVDGYIDVVELLLHLTGLVANVGRRGVGIRQAVTMSLPTVTAREHSHLHLLAQQVDEIFHVGRLSRAPHRDVAHTDDRNTETVLREHAQVEELVAHPHSHTI